MSISLTDIPALVADYLDTQVTTTVSAVTPKGAKQDVLTPGRDATFTVTVTNGDAGKGVRLINLTYHLKVADDTVLKLIPPSGALLRSYEDEQGTKLIDDGKDRSEMFVRLLSETTFDAGQMGSPIQIDVHVLDHGETSIAAHVHAEVDQDQLFPNSRNKGARQKVKVV